MNKIVTKKEACQKWVNGFNAIRESLIKRAFKNNIDDLYELTTVQEGDYVWSNEHQGEYEILNIDRENKKATINIDGEKQETELDDLTKEYEGWLPMWGTLWTFGENLDSDWARENPNIVSACGFRLFEDEDGEVYIGVDGAGYDFYEAHWIPLYEARGLHWHTEN